MAPQSPTADGSFDEQYLSEAELIAALRMFDAAGDIHLAAMCADNGRGPLFHKVKGDFEGAAKWIARHNADRRNIYWQPNSVREGTVGKASADDIMAIRFFQVDIDPPKDGTAFDIDGVVELLTKFEFARNGIESVEGSTFFDARWGEKFGDSTVKLTEVSFDHLNCRNVIFAPYNPLAGLGDLATNFSHFMDCSFMDSDLSQSKFNGSEMHWSNPPPDTHMEYWDEEDGTSGCAQISYRWSRHARLWGVVTRSLPVGANRKSATLLDPYGRGACGVCPRLFGPKATGLSQLGLLPPRSPRDQA